MKSYPKLLIFSFFFLSLSMGSRGQDTLRGKWQFQINFGIQFFNGIQLDQQPQNFKFQNLTNPAFEGGIGFLYHITSRIGLQSGLNLGFIPANFRHTTRAYDFETGSSFDYYIDEKAELPAPYARLQLGVFYRQPFKKGLSLSVGINGNMSYFAKASRIIESYFYVSDANQPDALISFSQLNNRNNIPHFGLNPELRIQRTMSKNTTLGFALGMNWSPQFPVSFRYSYMAPGVLEAGEGKQRDMSFYLKATVGWAMKKKRKSS